MQVFRTYGAAQNENEMQMTSYIHSILNKRYSVLIQTNFLLAKLYKPLKGFPLFMSIIRAWRTYLECIKS